ncbi:LLM class F420-dependent oxidoreductase [Actinocorallia lasiicapitis]
MRLSILIPFMPASGDQLMPFIELAENKSATRLWSGQSMLLESHAMFAYAAGRGLQTPIGTSVALMALRHPFQAALEARTLARLTGQSVVAGFGPGPDPFVESLQGRRYAKPRQAVHEYAKIVRGLLDGAVVEVEGEYFSMGGALPALATPPVEVGLGVLRPRMAELAGEVADVAITWLATPRYLTEVIAPAIAKGADRAGRPAPRSVSILQVSLGGPEVDHIQVILAACAAHLQAPHYQDMLRRAGIVVGEGSERRVVEQLILNQAAAVGDPEDILRVVDTHRRAGADEVVISTIGMYAVGGPAAALSALQEILDANRTRQTERV